MVNEGVGRREIRGNGACECVGISLFWGTRRKPKFIIFLAATGRVNTSLAPPRAGNAARCSVTPGTTHKKLRSRIVTEYEI
jgi:hypothetical protein